MRLRLLGERVISVIMVSHLLTSVDNCAYVLDREMEMKPKKTASEPTNPVLSVRVPPEYMEALEQIAKERNAENAKDLDNSYFEVTPQNITRALVKKFLVEQKRIKP
jgi:hypothetical protein